MTHLSSVITFVYGEKARATIASLSKIVMVAADNGDRIANEIIKAQSQQLGKELLKYKVANGFNR